MFLVLELKKALAVPVTLLLVLFFIYLFVITRIQEDALIQMVAAFSYVLLVLPFFWSTLKPSHLQGGGLENIFKLLLMVGLVRPLWRNLVEFAFFLLVKKLHRFFWFQKLIPHLSPGFDLEKLKDWENG